MPPREIGCWNDSRTDIPRRFGNAWDISGLQPLGSIFMGDTQCVALGWHKTHLWCWESEWLVAGAKTVGPSEAFDGGWHGGRSRSDPFSVPQFLIVNS